MVQVTLSFVPPECGEANYHSVMNLPEVPHAGDYISISRPGDEEPGTEDFIVRKTWWQLESPETEAHVEAGKEKPGKVSTICVECEFALAPFSSKNHKRECEMYQTRGELHGKHPPVKKFDNSMY